MSVRRFGGLAIPVTSQTNKINELYREAITTGCAPGNYCKVQILGDERVGKTSLRKNLMGEEFDPEQPSTFGIDTRMCNVKEVDEAWRERTVDIADGEFKDVVSWFCAKKFWKEGQGTQQTFDQLAYKMCVICFLLGLLSGVLVLAFFVDVSVSNSLSCLSWMACITLMLTKQGKYYLLLTGTADAIFTVNMIGYLRLSYGLPRFLWVTVFTLLAMQVGTTGVFEAIMGQNVILCVEVLSKNTDNRNNTGNWHDMMSLGDILAVTLCYVVGCNLVILLDTLAGYMYVTKRYPFLLTSSKHILIATILATFSMLISLTSAEDMLIMNVAGLCCGYGFAIGVTLGRTFVTLPLFNSFMKHRWLSLSLQIIYGWILVTLSGRVLPYKVADVVSVLQSGFIPLIIAEMYRNHLLQYNSSVVTVTSRVMKSKEDKLSFNLSIWDFAGQEVYYNAHHTFMSVHAVYVIVFDLMDFSEIVNRSVKIERIKFWINSVRQHANASILLVGTHGDRVDRQTIEETRRYVNNSLPSSMSANQVYNKGSCFFAIDNTNSSRRTSESENGMDDIDVLRKAIQSEARQVKRLSHEYPIRWRRFGEFITEWGAESTRPPYVTLSELTGIVSKFHIHTTKELMDMLMFFHENGEILYDSVDSVLRQFVVLDPQIMIDIMEALVVIPTSVCASKFTTARKHFERTGILEYTLLEHIIVSRLSTAKETTTQVIIGMLQAKDLICEVKRAKLPNSSQPNRSLSGATVFVVPSMLPASISLPSDTQTVSWNKKLYVNFGSMLPDAVFLRLLARCASYSDVISYGQDQCQLFRNGGFFTLGTNYFFMLRKLQPCDNQYLVEVSIKAAHDWHPLEVLKYLCSILDTLRCRDFPGIQFYAGMLCPFTEAPHQGCKDTQMMHVLDLSDEMERGHGLIRRWCNGRLIHADVDELETPLASDEGAVSEPINITVQGDHNLVVVGGNQSRIVINNRAGSCSNTLQDNPNELSTAELGIDVYISCSPHDEGWIQEHLVRYLTGPPHYLTVCVNQYDIPTQPLHAQQQNVKQIGRSALFVIVCSRYYNEDPTGRLQFEREVARKGDVKMICVTVKDFNKSKVDDLFDVEEVSLTSGDGGYLGRSLDMLLEEVLDQKNP